MTQPTENVIKQGYLRKGNSGGNRLSGLWKRFEGNKWYVFTIHQGTPYLEYYENDSDVFSQRPINSYCLSHCQSITSMGRSSPLTFYITCADRFLELIASSRAQMLDWVNEMETCLSNLGILKKELSEHVYSMLPAVVRQPKISKVVLSERKSMPAAVPSSSRSGNSSLPPPCTDQSEFMNEPPPLPQRPPSLPPRSVNLSSESSIEKESATVINDSGDSSTQCSNDNDSDFVSWEVLMQVRENHLNKSGDLGSCSLSKNPYVNNPGEHMFGQDDDTNILFTTVPAHTPIPVDGRNLLDTDDTCELSEPSFLEHELGAFRNLEDMSGLEVVEENEYSCLPLSHKEEDITKVNAYETMNKTVKPIPLPRRGFSLRSDQSQNNLRKTEMNSQVTDLETTKPSPSSLTSGSQKPQSETTESMHAPSLSDYPEGYVLENNSHCSLKSNENEPRSEGFQDTPFNDFHFSHKIPSVPPRFDSLHGVSLSTHKCSSSGAEQNNSAPSSFPLSVISKSPHETSQQEGYTTDSFHMQSIPPLPLPRRRNTTLSSRSIQLRDENTMPPPMPPRRGMNSSNIPQQSPPALPSRNSISSSFSARKYGDGHFADDNTKTKGGQDPGHNSAFDETSVCRSHTVSKVSGLSKKMQLDRANSLHTVVSLKQTQVEILQAEIDRPHVNVSLTQKSGYGVALVDWSGMPCVIGWNQKDFPSLHGKFHIGDLLISVNNVRVSSSAAAQKLLKHTSEPRIEIMLHRMPYAKVVAIQRRAEGQSLGLKREGGTGEILYVDPNGLAAQHGLPQYAVGVVGKSRCSWCLTEINSRPLNLFFKEDEIEHRLQAVGKEITIVVQPSDFILEMRRGLKKLKNYKDYIIQ